MICKYPDSAIFYEVASKANANSKIVKNTAVVPVIFMQSTGYVRGGYQENYDSDATMFIDPNNAFSIDNYMRFEGMLVRISPFGAPDNASWYKITHCDVNKRHLGNNDIDNIYVQLKKTAALEGAS